MLKFHYWSDGTLNLNKLDYNSTLTLKHLKKSLDFCTLPYIGTSSRKTCANLKFLWYKIFVFYAKNEKLVPPIKHHVLC